MKARADGRYCKQIVIGHDINGKKIVKSVYGFSPEEVEEKANSIKADIGRGVDVIGAEMTFRDWVKMFLRSEERRLTHSEYTCKRSRIDAFISYIGDMPIRKIKPYHIEMCLNDLAVKNPRTGKPSSDKTVKEYRNDCNQVFKYAAKNRALEFNPCEYATLPKARPKKERRALTAEERKHLESLTCEGRFILMTACYSGLRKGELAALTWKDIDLENRTITVNKSWNFKTKSLKTPKTKAGQRTVPITDKLYAEFLANEKDGGLVFTYRGEHLTDATCDKLLMDALSELNKKYGREVPPVKVGSKYRRLITIEPFGYHDLRHTYTSLLYQSGVDLYSAMEILGHSNVQTTLSVYTHLQKEQKAQSIDKLNEFLGK